MGNNEISETHPRIGWLMTDREGAPQFPGMLTMEGRRLRLTVPTPGMIQAETQPCPYTARWPSSEDEAEGTLPHEILFHDVHGSISLIGCAATSWNQGGDAGQVSCRPDFAVMDAATLGYSTIQGMRVDMPALISWTGLRSLDLKIEPNDEGKARAATVRAEAPDAIEVSSELRLHIKPTWRTHQRDSLGEFGMAEAVEVATASEQPLSWDAHLKPVSAMRDLVVVAGWRNFGFRQIMVNRRDDPQRVMSGDAIGERWARVVTHRFPFHEDWEKAPRFLFQLDDIGPHGLETWLSFREDYQRAVAPLVGIASRPEAYLEARLMHSGVAIESAGYIARREAGESGRFNYRAAAETILSQMNYIPFEDASAWLERSTRTYREVKHADNPYPNTIEMVNAVRENCLILRCWFALRLGVPTETLKRNVELDPMSKELRPA